MGIKIGAAGPQKQIWVNGNKKNNKFATSSLTLTISAAGHGSHNAYIYTTSTSKVVDLYVCLLPLRTHQPLLIPTGKKRTKGERHEECFFALSLPPPLLLKEQISFIDDRSIHPSIDCVVKSADTICPLNES